jgi:uncharacterized protein
MTVKRKSLAKRFLGLSLITLFAVITALWVISGQILSPERQQIHDYQQEWLNKASIHGMRVHQAKCDKGLVPCIFVSPDAASEPGERGKLIRLQLQAHSVSLKAYGETQGILLLLHGRNGRKEALLPIAERFAALGFKCVIPDLPAHGDSPIKEIYFATTDFERSIANNVLADAREYFGDQISPAMIWGLSMGGAYAVDAVSRTPSNWKAIVVISSFDSLEGVVEDSISSFPKVLVSTISRILFEIIEFRSGFVVANVQPVQWANKITRPALVAHGDVDSLVSMERGKRLFNAIGSREKLWITVPGANHNNIFITDMPLFAAMGEWFIGNI